jgi:hypothetical protein
VNLYGLLAGAVQWWGQTQRSGRWPAVRDKFIRQNPTCAACGKRDTLEAHHVVPFQEAPALELDPGNLITLCRTCHLVFGHLGDWASWNPEVRVDASAYLAKRLQRPPNNESDAKLPSLPNILPSLSQINK